MSRAPHILMSRTLTAVSRCRCGGVFGKLVAHVNGVDVSSNFFFFFFAFNFVTSRRFGRKY